MCEWDKHKVMECAKQCCCCCEHSAEEQRSTEAANSNHSVDFVVVVVVVSPRLDYLEIPMGVNFIIRF